MRCDHCSLGKPRVKESLKGEGLGLSVESCSRMREEPELSFLESSSQTPPVWKIWSLSD